MLFLVILPLAELAVLIQVGSLIGAPATILLVLATSFAGAALVRREGRRAWRDLRAVLDTGRWPGDEVARGSLVILGGVLLLLPGFLTDVVGFLLLVPPVRGLVARRVQGRAARSGPEGEASERRGPAVGAGPGARGPRRGRASGTGRPGASDGDVLDVEVLEVRRDDDAS